MSRIIRIFFIALIPFLAHVAMAGYGGLDKPKESTQIKDRFPVRPQELNERDWAAIQAKIHAHQFQTRAGADGAYAAVNPSHGWRIKYQADGQTVLRPTDTSKADYQISLQLQAWGYGDELNTIDTRPTLSANGQNVAYQWTSSLREWWTNSPRGVEQRFELAERPTVYAVGKPLVLSMQLNTTLRVSFQNNALWLRSSDGVIDITYDQLKVWDATGRILKANMQLDGSRLALYIYDQNAVYPITIDPIFAQIAYLKASNVDAGDFFGQAVAIDDNTLVIGTPFEDSNASSPSNNSAMDSGAAYVFVRDGAGGWSQQAYLKASNTGAGDWFGFSVAIDGDTIVIGAPGESSNGSGPGNNSLPRAGAAYVFVRSDTTWIEQDYLKPLTVDTFDEFGWSVVIDSTTVIVGARGEDSNGSSASNNSAVDSGTAYVFLPVLGNWSQRKYVKASNAGTGDRFGTSVGLDGDALVVGAPEEDGNGITNSGAAYTFDRSGILWIEDGYLKADNLDQFDRFGASVSVDGDMVAVGATGESSNGTGPDNNSAVDAGAVYVFRRTGDFWVQQDYLKANNADQFDEFGSSVSIVDNALVVGAPGESGDGSGPDNDSVIGAGAAYLFILGDAGWNEEAYLKAANVDFEDRFGGAVAVSGNTILVGVIEEDGDGSDPDNNDAIQAGAAYLFGSVVVFSIGGTVSGLTGNGLTLQNNGGDDLTIVADGVFTFNTPVVDGQSYKVTVAAQPTSPDQICSVTNGSGTVNGMAVTEIQIDCQLPSAINVLPPILDFGEQLLGITTASQMIVVESTGEGDLVIDPVTLKGPQATDYQIIMDSCSGATLPTGAACGIDVAFTANAPGVRNAWVEIRSNAPNSPSLLNLIGTNDVLFFDGFEQE